MIRFIDLTDQIEEGVKHFAFFNTVIDGFDKFSGAQVFDSLQDFKLCYDGDDLQRYLHLIPESFK